MLARDRRTIATWGCGSSAGKAVRLAEAEQERAVSAYLGDMTFLWIEVPDEPGTNSMRAYVERNAIGLLSNALRPVDPPSREWLGHHSPNDAIRRSGLWNLDHVEFRHEPAFLDVLERLVTQTRER